RVNARAVASDSLKAVQDDPSMKGGVDGFEPVRRICKIPALGRLSVKADLIFVERAVDMEAVMENANGCARWYADWPPDRNGSDRDNGAAHAFIPLARRLRHPAAAGQRSVRNRGPVSLW